MTPDPIERDCRTLPVPPSYAQLVAAPTGLKAKYVVAPYIVSPLAMVALFAWDEEDDS